jgi:GT2 family glycosyltransferase
VTGPTPILDAVFTPDGWMALHLAAFFGQADAVDALLAAGADPRTACVAPRLILPDGSTQHSLHSFPTLAFTLAFNLGLHRLSRRLGERLCLEGFLEPGRPRKVPWAIGAFLLLRRTAFAAVGGFDETQWMYAEDLDLGWRLARAGWVTRYEPRARVRHEAGAATALAFGDRTRASFMAATYAVLRKRRGGTRAWLTAALNIAGAAARLAWMTPLAIVLRRWRGPRHDMKVWLSAHLEGLRRAPPALDD